MDEDKIAHQHDLLNTHRRTLAHELRRAANYGGVSCAPPEVAHNIALARTEIQHIKEILRTVSEVIEDLPDDEEPPAQQDMLPAQPAAVDTQSIVAHSVANSTLITGHQVNVQTSGGDYAQGNIDKRQGTFIDHADQVYVSFNHNQSDQALVAAQQLLDSMPLDTIPAIGSLPLPHRVKHSRNPLFVGRETHLMQIAARLKGGGTAAIGQVAAATGLGGLGKTNLATEFIHRYGQYFAGGVFWLSFADAASIHSEIADCGRVGAMDLPGFDELKLDEQVRRVIQEWQSPMPRLLVFDNCEDEVLFEKWKPVTGGCRVLITSRRSTWDLALSVHSITLDVLHRTDSVALLRKFRPDLLANDPNLDAISTELGDLPLALHLAGSYLARYRNAMLPAAYLAQLRSPELLQHGSLQGSGKISPTGHIQHIERTFALSYEQLNVADPTDKLAIMLLTRAACFAPGEPIPRTFLLGALSLPSDDISTTLQAEDALGRLIGLGLLEEETETTLKLHRLLAVFIKQAAAEDTALIAVEQFLEKTLLEYSSVRLHSLSEIRPHLIHTATIAIERGDKAGARFTNRVSTYLKQIGDFGTARTYTERVLQIHKKIYGNTHWKTVSSLNNLAEIFRVQGQYKQARELHLQSLRIRERMLGANHLETAKSLSNLARVLEALGEFEQAHSFYEQALRIREQELGLNHPDTAASLNNLAGSLRWKGQYSQAEELYRRALRIREQELGLNHPDTAASLNNLANVLKQLGQYAQARVLYEQALEIREQILGSNSPLTASSLNNLAELLRSQGEYEQAHSLHERALRIRQEVFGFYHPDTASSLNNLATLLLSQGNLDTAYSLSSQAYQIRKEVFGSDHHATAASLNNLGRCKELQGEDELALAAYQEAVRIREQTLGEHHLDTLTSRFNLARMYTKSGQYQVAYHIYNHVLNARERILGNDHPDIADTLEHFANLLQELGEHPQAQHYYERALRIRAHALEQEHSDTSNILNGLASRLPSDREDFDVIPMLDERDKYQQGDDYPISNTTYADLIEERAEIAAQIEAMAQWIEEGEDKDSPNLPLASRLRAQAP